MVEIEVEVILFVQMPLPQFNESFFINKLVNNVL
jgi:hypothetical protein